MRRKKNMKGKEKSHNLIERSFKKIFDKIKRNFHPNVQFFRSFNYLTDMIQLLSQHYSRNMQKVEKSSNYHQSYFRNYFISKH